jgi:hypothetical protein
MTFRSSYATAKITAAMQDARRDENIVGDSIAVEFVYSVQIFADSLLWCSFYQTRVVEGTVFQTNDEFPSQLHGNAPRTGKPALFDFHKQESQVRNSVLFLSKNRDIQSKFRSGVSLHGHTKHSLERLSFLGRFLREHRLLRHWIAKQARRCEQASGIKLDFDRAYWTPPLTAQLAHALETRQIESIGLCPMVSLSDHDNIRASTLLRQVPETENTPISVEWTVPFGKTEFHVGVHNMPGAIADDLMSIMTDCAIKADDQHTTDLIAELQLIPSLLLVFNHPVWNFHGIAQDVFDFELDRFLQSNCRHFHAFEINGMRSRHENHAVIQLAAKWNQILVSGGDRHACEPNALLNLTNATVFPEFIDEIRNRKQSTLLVMPQYSEPLAWRLFRSFSDVIREYPGRPQSERKWDQRTFHPDLAGNMAPLSELWPKGAPSFLRKLLALSVMASRLPVHWAMRKPISTELSESFLLANEFAPSQVDLPKEQLQRIDYCGADSYGFGSDWEELAQVAEGARAETGD